MAAMARRAWGDGLALVLVLVLVLCPEPEGWESAGKSLLHKSRRTHRYS